MAKTEKQLNLYNKYSNSDSISERYIIAVRYLKDRLRTLEPIIKGGPSDNISEEELIDLVNEMFVDIEIASEALSSCYPNMKIYLNNY